MQTVGELAAIPEDTLVRALGNASGHHLHALAWNRDERPVVPEQEVKSIGHEETFPSTSTTTPRSSTASWAWPTAWRRACGPRGVTARTVQLKVRFGDFTTITRSRTLPEPTDLAADLGRVARELLRPLDVGPGVRLLGISAQQLVRHQPRSGTEPEAVRARSRRPGGRRAGREGQGQLFAEPGPDGAGPGPDPDRQAALERSVDAVRARFGPGAVGPGRAE